MKIVVIGGGASGLVAAIFAKKENNEVLVLERFDKSAKKILVTGNGRCNYWNENFTNDHFYSSNPDFIEKINTYDNRHEILSFFESIGIIPTIKNGYYYPMSREASSIRNALLNKVNMKKINILNNINVINIEKINNKFIIKYENGTISCDKIIMATGSNAYYKENTSGYDICKKLGHNIKQLSPSLVQLIGKENYFKEASGVRNNVKLSIYVDNILQKEETGEIQLTEYGLSGICIYNLSSLANRAINNNKKVEIKINFLPEIKDINTFLQERNNRLNNCNLDTFLEGILNYKLIKTILKRINLSNRTYSSLNEKEKQLLIENITSFSAIITGSKSFDEAQTSLGGIDTTEINSSTFESKVCNDLFIVGEMLDVDGECGGYNLGFAFLSGMIAGKSVNND